MQTCPKSSKSAIISETMRRIEIRRALYFIQLLILVSGGRTPLTLEQISTRFEELYDHQNVSVDFL